MFRTGKSLVRRYGLLACLLFTLSSVVTAAPEPVETRSSVKFGFFPIISTVALFKRFSPLRDYLSDTLGLKVELETAKNFPTFYQRTNQGEFDLVITAPHFAVRAADSGRYEIVATLVKPVQQVFVVHKNSKFKSIEDFAGKKIATPPASALMTMMGKAFLRQHGLDNNKKPTFQAYTSHNAANEALLAGEVVAAIASTNVVNKAIKQGEPLRIIARGLRLPNMATLVASDLNDDLKKKIRDAFIGMNDTEQGQQVLKKIGLPGYKPATNKDYEPARPYMELANEIYNMKF